jgi:hypothetical protein
MDVIEEHRVLPLTADLLKELGKEHGWLGRPAQPEEYRALPPEQFEEVVDAALEDLRKQAEESTLLSRYPLDECLYFWRAAAGAEELTTYLKKLVEDRDSFKTLVRAFVGEEAADQLEKGEPVSDESTAVARLRPLRVFDLDGEARARADEILEGNVSDEDRALLEWFLRTHESANRPIED